MAWKVFETDSFEAIEMRVGYLLRDKRTTPPREVYFQPGDATTAISDAVDALSEVPETKRATVFDILAAEYF